MLLDLTIESNNNTGLPVNSFPIKSYYIWKIKTIRGNQGLESS